MTAVLIDCLIGFDTLKNPLQRHKSELNQCSGLYGEITV